MKKIIYIIIVLALIGYFFPKAYTSSPGFVIQEAYQEFEASKPTCLGYSYLKNAEAVAADAPGESLCFGWLSK